MKKSMKRALSLSVAGALLMSSSVYAFNDIQNSPNRNQIMELKQNGVVNGVSKDQFNPQGEMTYAQAVSMVVSGFNLNLAHMLFIKAPQASDSFTQVPEDAWYSQSFIIAGVYGLAVDRDVNPSATITREEFASLIMSAIEAKGNYAFTEMYFTINDEADIDPDSKGDIQSLLNASIVELDENQNFYPKRVITRGEAAGILYEALQMVDNQEPVDTELPDGDDPVSNPIDSDLYEGDEEVTLDDEPVMKVNKLDSGVQEVTVTWGVKPNSGYYLILEKVEFTESGEAHVYVRKHVPVWTESYLQALTQPKVNAYVGGEYTPVLKVQEPIEKENPFAGPPVEEPSSPSTSS
ncbi:S-layer homology domain-containing protein [Marinicrinis sediminis]|uniref:S-layer homology domain-containing protein n=1 Tax=Marinicrinis sediminis TaxID=1652465 RepID=A0ABW5RDY2_9BACL